jgi:hypothetical protein
MDWILDLLTIYTHHLELQIITALLLSSTIHISLHAKCPPVCNVFNSHFLVTDGNSRNPSASLAKVLPSIFQYRPACQLSNEPIIPFLFFITSRRGPRRQYPIFTFAYVTVATGTCSTSRCIATAVVSFLSRTLPSSWSIRHNTHVTWNGRIGE